MALFTVKSVLEDNNKVIENYLSFPESLISPLWDAYIFNYGCMNFYMCCCPDSVRVSIDCLC